MAFPWMAVFAMSVLSVGMSISRFNTKLDTFKKAKLRAERTQDKKQDKPTTKNTTTTPVTETSSAPSSVQHQ